MDILIIVAAVVGAVVLVPVAIGSVLSPSFRAQADHPFNHPVERVWEVLHAYHDVPMSGKQCRGVREVDSQNGLPAWKEDMGPSVATIETVESEPPNRVVRRFSDSVVPMTMRCEYRLSPIPQGCQVIASAEGAIERGSWHVPLFRFTVKILGMARRGQVLYLRAVERHLDAAAEGGSDVP